MEKISKIQVKNEIYELADSSLMDLVTETDKFLKIDKDGNITAVEITTEEPKVVEANGKYYADLESALAENTTGTIKLFQNITMSSRPTIASGSNLVFDLNGFTIFAPEDIKGGQCLFYVDYGATVKITGNGTIDAGKGTPIGVWNANRLAESGETATLVIDNGTFLGLYYALAGNGKATAQATDITINGGTFKATYYTDGVALFQPQPNSKLTINGGEFIGATAMEIRSGEATVNYGSFEGKGSLYYGPNGSGTTSTGCGINVSQHSTKNPIKLVINDGLFKGQVGLFEQNPQKNSAEDLKKVELVVNGGMFVGEDVPIYSEDKTAFVKKENVRANKEIDAEYVM